MRLLGRTARWMLVLLTLGVAGGCGRYLIYVHLGYRGTVMDAESGEPIVGAVVASSCWIETRTPAGDVASHLACKEAVTDPRGRFRIPVLVSFKPWAVISYLEKHPSIVACKVGYETVEIGSGHSREHGSDGRLVIWTHRLRTHQELQNNDLPDGNHFPPEECPKLGEMRNEARAALELEPY